MIRNINKFHFGLHMGLKGKTPLQNSIIESQLLGITCLQLFLRSPYGRSKMKCNDKKWRTDARNARRLLRKHDMRMFIHAPYILNLAKDFTKKENIWQCNSILDDLKCATITGADGVVIHVGKCNTKNKKYTEEEGLENMKKSIDHIIKLYKEWDWPEKKNKKRARLLIETAAGQGSELCVKIDVLGKLFHKIEYKDCIGICVDSCHVFAAGYDLTTSELVKVFFEEQLEKYIGLENIYLIHLNDSKDKCGFKKDRHERLGEGYIGIEGIQEIVKQCKQYKLPMILETKGPYENQLQIVSLNSD